MTQWSDSELIVGDKKDERQREDPLDVADETVEIN